VLGGAVLVVLIVGAAIGMLITRAATNTSGPPGPDSIDVGFAQDMKVHHLQAITMAGVAREHTTDELVHSLAFDIESTQLDQVGEMTGWLTVWGRPELPQPGRQAMSWMTGASGHSHTVSPDGAVRMPGMATPEELSRLKSLSGKELDVYFLQLMLRHHQGAVPMAQYAVQHAGVGFVRDLAQKMVTSQSYEVTQMIKMLADRGANPLPPPN
jgi:uncharacterized protein (DUF305 family)